MESFIHTADTHLGYHQYHRAERARDYLDAFQQVIDAAIEHDVDGIIHAGDLFHDSRPSTRTIRATLDELRRIRRHDIEFLAVVGNHEHSRDDQWIDIFSELGLAIHLDRTPTVIGDTAIYGLDHLPPSKRDHVTLDFEPTTAASALLVAHGLFSPISPHGTWDLNHLLAQSQIPFDAILLGDDHTPRVDQINDIPVTYAGSTDRTAIDQTSDRTCNLVTINAADTDVHIDQLPLDTRPHVFIHADLTPGDGAGEIRRRLDRHELTGAVVAIRITGDGEDIVPADLEEYGKSQGALVVRVSDRRDLTIEDIDIDVAFADPDDAVQERISQMPLSVAAYDIEQYVRNIKGHPKSNLADVVEAEITTRIDETPEDFDDEATITPPPPPEPHEPPPDEARQAADQGDTDKEPAEADDSDGTETVVQVRFEDYSE